MSSSSIFQEAQSLFPGGVNSPVRAFRSVKSEPFVVSKGEGSRLIDCDGKSYIDFVMSWGPLVLGHAHPEVMGAVIGTLQKGWSYGAPCEAENLLAKKVRELYPSMERMRFTSSGTEAVMGALRLARGITGKELIIKCDGGYHGHSDPLLVSGGSGLATLGTSSSAGVPEAFASTTLVIPINDLGALEKALKDYDGRVAAFIQEPVNGNVGVIPPEAGYLEGVRELTREHGVQLVYDEVMCGFRAALGGAQEMYGIVPDITVLGKVIGGGFPVGAYGSSSEAMAQIAPEGPVYQAGTLSGNPVAMSAGLSTLNILQREGFKVAMERMQRLENGILKIKESYPEVCWQRVGTMFSLFLTKGPVRNLQDSSKVDQDRFARFHRFLLDRGIYFAPSSYEAGFMSSAHLEAEIDYTLQAIEDALSQLD
jgi:glutamate-1-semialdehyde 2,1-aminomutase